MTSPRSGSSTTTGALDHRAGAEDADLRLVDDRGVEQRAPAAGVGQRERAAGQLVRADLVGPGALGQVGDPLGQAGQVEVAGVVDDRDDQAALGVHRDAQVLGVVVGDRAGLDVDRGVDRSGAPAAPRPRPGRRTAGRTASRRALAWKSALAWSRSLAIRVTSTSTTVVSCAETCSDSTIRRAMTRAHAGSASRCGRAAGSAAGFGRRRGGRGGRGGRRGGRRRPWPPAAFSAASSTSCLRIRPPTPVPVSEARSTPCSAASLRTSGVT